VPAASSRRTRLVSTFFSEPSENPRATPASHPRASQPAVGVDDAKSVDTSVDAAGRNARATKQVRDSSPRVACTSHNPNFQFALAASCWTAGSAGNNRSIAWSLSAA
jgi:hypothetical protein